MTYDKSVKVDRRDRRIFPNGILNGESKGAKRGLNRNSNTMTLFKDNSWVSKEQFSIVN